MNILYSFTKCGAEARYWEREIAAASDADFTFIPFNYSRYLHTRIYSRAQLLDDLYYERHVGLYELYAEFERLIQQHAPTAMIVDTCPVFHPDYLRQFSLYKVLRIGDGPISAYDRDFAYLHAYDHIFYHSPAYSSDLGMADKLRYCGAHNSDFWPMALFDAAFDSTKTPEALFEADRDIDIIFIGALHLGKMATLARVKKAFGRRCRMYGLTNLKRNVYFNVKYGFPGWIRTIPIQSYVPLYQRAKIGFNIHNRGDFSVGNYRLFELPANGVMQISDGGMYLEEFFTPDREIIRYSNVDDLIDRLRYYLEHDDERKLIALNGYRRVLRDHRFRTRMRQAGELIQQGMSRPKSELSRSR